MVVAKNEVVYPSLNPISASAEGNHRKYDLGIPNPIKPDTL
jgi:hypothetical protein